MSHHNRGGYTLLELIIVMGIIGLISVPLTSFIINGMRSYQFLQSESNTSADLGALSVRIGRVVRGTTGVIDAQSNSLTLYGYFSPQDTIVKKVRYFVAGNNLNIGVTSPTGTAPNYTYDPATETIQTVRLDLAMGSNPLFTYYDDAGNQLGGGFQVSQVKQVGLYLAANDHNKSLSVPVSLQTRLTLRNFKTNL